MQVRQDFLKKAYRVVEDFYLRKVDSGEQHGDANKLRERLTALENLRHRAEKENSTLSSHTPWGEPIMAVLDRIVQEKDAAPLPQQLAPLVGTQASRSAHGERAGPAGRTAHHHHDHHAEKEAEEATTSKARSTASTARKAAKPSTTSAPFGVLLAAGAKERETLFCFSLMMPSGLEPKLLALQVSRGVSIFACDGYAVYSRDRMRLGPGPPPYEVETTPIYISVHANTDAKARLLNAEVFMRVWEAVFQSQQFWHYDWTVKIDPDCVMVPSVLRAHLQMTWGSVARSEKFKGRGLYLRNCAPAHDSKFGLLGAMEVLSRQAVEVYARGKLACAVEVNHAAEMEDQFLQNCLDLLEIPHRYDFGLVNDANCIGHPRPCSSGHAAFHPMKSMSDYSECIRVAGHSHDQKDNKTEPKREARVFLG